MRSRSLPRAIQSILAALLLTLAFAAPPAPVSADTDLFPGEPAIVACANGDPVNMRSAGASDAPILATVPEGTTVPILDGPFTAPDGSMWYQVDYEGVVGYLNAEFLTSELGVGGDGDTAHVTEQVWVRSGPGTEHPILGQYYGGEEVVLYGEYEDGFYAVVYDIYVGWVSETYLNLDSSTPAPTTPTQPTQTPVVTPAPTTPPVQVTPEPTTPPVVETPAPSIPAGGDIIWPVSGGEWEVLQGYNGSSHYNSGLWQYRDSLDIVRSDGSTAGESVYSPVNGTIRWFDPSSGGISIDMGNGYALAMFHAYYDSSLQVGDRLTQGQYIGTIAPAYQAAAGSSPHLHIALWSTEDGGNWSRTSTPFVGQNAISGEEFYNSGTSFQHTGYVFYP